MSTAQLYVDYQPGVPTYTPTVSFELYPPRNPSRTSGVWAGVNKLISSAPDYVSVTYGAAGASADTRDRSVQVLLQVLDQHPGLPAVAHLTCLGSTRNELALIVRLLLRAGIRDFLALRGDPPSGSDTTASQLQAMHTPDAPKRGVDLVRLIREVAAEELPHGVGTRANGTGVDTAKCPEDYVSIAVAAYPATVGRARANDIAALLEKQSAGADYAVTQVFYEAQQYASFIRELTLSGGKLPIVPGILPLHDLKRLKAMERIAGIPVPQRVHELFNNAKNPADQVARTLQATVDLIAECIDAGAPGVHLYTFNRPRPTLDLLEYLRGGGYLNRPQPGAPPQGHHVPRVGEIDTELVRLALHRIPPSA